MANTNAKLKNINKMRQLAERKEQEKKLMQAQKKAFWLKLAALAVAVASLLLFFVKWLYVYNTDFGVEVEVNGFNFMAAGFSGVYNSPSHTYGDLAMPFFYYAAGYCKGLGALTATAFVVSLILVIFQAVALADKKHATGLVTAVISFVQFGLLIACFATALAVKDARVLSVYCGGNPACSIQSLAVIPAVIALANVALGTLGYITFKKGQKVQA